MAKDKKDEQPKEKYLKIPYHILSMKHYCLGEKVLYAFIYSFGAKGCYCSNKQLAKMLDVCERTIKSWLRSIRNMVYVKSAKGFYRTFYAKAHPDVIESNKLWYRNKEIPKIDVKLENIEEIPLGQILPSTGANSALHWCRFCPASRQNPVLSLGQKLPTTINHTIKDNKKETTATPTPLPAGGQAPALLDEQKENDKKTYEETKRKLGISKKKYTPLTEKEIQDRKQKLRKDLLAAESLKVPAAAG